MNIAADKNVRAPRQTCGVCLLAEPGQGLRFAAEFTTIADMINITGPREVGRQKERSDKERREAEVRQDPATTERLKSPKKARPSITIAPSTSPGPDVRIRPPE